MLECEECRRTAENFELGWSAFYVPDPDEGDDADVVAYRPECLAREFGGVLHRVAAPAPQRS